MNDPIVSICIPYFKRIEYVRNIDIVEIIQFLQEIDQIYKSIF